MSPPLEWLIWIYAMFYIGWSALGLWDSIQTGHSPSMVFFEFIGAALAITGMSVYLYAAPVEMTQHLWKGVTVFIIGTHFYLLSRDYRWMVDNPEADLDEETMASLARWSTVISGVLMLPAFWINLLVALGRYSNI